MQSTKKKSGEFLFEKGSMIGLSAPLLGQYVEWIANRRLKGIGLKPIYDVPGQTIHFRGLNTG